MYGRSYYPRSVGGYSAKPRTPRPAPVLNADAQAAIGRLVILLSENRLNGWAKDTASDLITKAGRWAPSDKQVALMNRIADEAEGKGAPKPTTELGGDVAAIFRLFTVANERGLKYPKIVLAAADGTPVEMYRAGERSKTPGHVQVTDGSGYGGRYFGRIAPDGVLVEGRAITQPVRDLLATFAANPAAVAAAYGKETGACCFCRRELTTAESTEVGYGPNCAEKYDLPWGTKRRGEEEA